MKKGLENYDSVSERLPDNATASERLEKFTKIIEELKKHDIWLLGLNYGCPTLGNNKGWKLTHNILTWEVFRVQDVVTMILNNRDNKFDIK